VSGPPQIPAPQPAPYFSAQTALASVLIWFGLLARSNLLTEEQINLLTTTEGVGEREEAEYWLRSTLAEADELLYELQEVYDAAPSPTASHSAMLVLLAGALDGSTRRVYELRYVGSQEGPLNAPGVRLRAFESPEEALEKRRQMEEDGVLTASEVEVVAVRRPKVATG